MDKQLRIWRVVPVSKTNVHAPYYFVETTEKNREKAYEVALKEAKSKSALSRFTDWNFRVERQSLRKDDFGRYIVHHQ
jgi:hypothetical protein